MFYKILKCKWGSIPPRNLREGSSGEGLVLIRAKGIPAERAKGTQRSHCYTKAAPLRPPALPSAFGIPKVLARWHLVTAWSPVPELDVISPLVGYFLLEILVTLSAQL